MKESKVITYPGGAYYTTGGGGSRSYAEETVNARIKRLPKAVSHNGSGTRSR